MPEIPQSVRLRWLGLVALLGVAAFLVIVVALHWLQPGYDPRNQLMSELALGPHGSAMLGAFAGVAASFAAIAFAGHLLKASRWLQVLLWVSASCFLAAGVFPLGETSTMHIAAIAAAFVIAVVAIYLFPSIGRGAAPLSGLFLSWTCAGGVAASVALGHSVLAMGVGQRLAASFLLAWVTVVGCRLIRRRLPPDLRSDC